MFSILSRWLQQIQVYHMILEPPWAILKFWHVIQLTTKIYQKFHDVLCPETALRRHGWNPSSRVKATHWKLPTFDWKMPMQLGSFVSNCLSNAEQIWHHRKLLSKKNIGFAYWLGQYDGNIWYLGPELLGCLHWLQHITYQHPTFGCFEMLWHPFGLGSTWVLMIPSHSPVVDRCGIWSGRWSFLLAMISWKKASHLQQCENVIRSLKLLVDILVGFPFWKGWTLLKSI